MIATEVTLLRALSVVEANLRIGYSPRTSIAKACDLLQVSALELALLLVEKVDACSRAREERVLLDAYDRMVDAMPAREARAR